nr:MAG TPA: hypothetical protein [Caudoviricetes sp.]
MIADFYVYLSAKRLGITLPKVFSSRFLARQAAAHLDPGMTVSRLTAD